jgi:N-acetylglutamate synthase-like GNAT family acetyltransferase
MDSVVRLGDQADESAIIRLLVQMHQENGLFPFSINRVRELVRMVLDAPKKPLATPAMIGVIGTPTDMQATIGLMVSRIYYTDEWHLGDLWVFVRPDCRKSTHAKALLEFGKRTASDLGLKFMSGVVSNARTEEKMRLYRRRLGTSVGGYFLYDPVTAA